MDGIEKNDQGKSLFLRGLLTLEKFLSPDRLKESRFLKLVYLFAAITLFLLPILIVYRPYGFQDISRYRPYVIPVSALGEFSPEQKSELQEIQNLLDRKEYDLIEDRFLEESENANLQDLHRFLTGYIKLDTGFHDEAVNVFQEISGDLDGRLKEDCLWYLGMTYLKIKAGDEALQTFNDITGLQGTRAEKAGLMVKEIQIWLKQEREGE